MDPRVHTALTGQCLVFYVNGRKVTETEPAPDCTLLQYLRRTLQMPGTKEGCGHGGCGSCTVMISRFDTKAMKLQVNACLFPLCAVHGLSVTTVEGVGNTRTGLHAVQKRLIESHGLQCGFCTPGFVMSVFTLLRNRRKPTRAQLEKALEGNLCRCTGYRPILEAFSTFTQEACPLGDDCCRNSEKHDTQSASESKDTCSDTSQVPIFPAELQLTDSYSTSTVTFRGSRWSWIRPVTLQELLVLKDKYRHAPVIMGNTTAALQLKEGKFDHSPVLLYGAAVPRLKEVAVTDSSLNLGAAITLTELGELLESESANWKAENKVRFVPALKEMVNRYGSDQIRNVATLGGSILSGRSNSDVVVLFTALNARMCVASVEGERLLDFGDLLSDNEVIVSIVIPFTAKCDHVMFHKQSDRRSFCLATVNCGMLVSLDDVRKVKQLKMTFGGLGDGVLTARDTTAGVVGSTWNEDCLHASIKLLTEELSSHIVPSPESYKMAVASAFFFKFYKQVLQESSDSSVTDSNDALASLSLDPAQGIQLYDPCTDKNQAIWDEVGRPLPNVSSDAIVTGEAIYIDDLPSYQGELFLALVTSTKAHARIISVDRTEALAVPGVQGYVDHTDIPGKNSWGPVVKDEEIFASREVHHYGQPIGGILAVSREVARRAARLVKVEYEEMPAIVTIQDAIRKGSYFPKTDIEVVDGDPEEAFLSADRVIEGEYYSGLQEHFYLEPHAALAIPKVEEGEMELFAGAHNLVCVQDNISQLLGLSKSKLVVKVKRLGGSFGGKDCRNIQVSGPAAIAAYKTKRPVRCVLSRQEDMLISGKRDPFLGKYKVGCMADCRITALDLTMYVDAGYSQDCSYEVLSIGAILFEAGYKIPNIRLKGLVCRTNTPSNTSFRGFGAPQAALVTEDAIFNVACTLGKTQEEVRQVNLYKEGDVTHYHMTLTECKLTEIWAQCQEQSHFQARSHDVQEFNKNHRWKKRGIAMTTQKFGIGLPALFLNQAAALVNIYTDGSVLIAHGGVEMGQGLNTKLIQIASRTLGIPTGKIFISETSTSTVPNSLYYGGSMGTELFGPAVMDACSKLRQRLEPIRKANPEKAWEELIFDAYMSRVQLSATGFNTLDRTEDFSLEKKTGRPFHTFSFGVACTEVEVDILTGENQVLQTDIVMDVGKSLNPAIEIGQIEGGFVQGLGMVTTEDVTIDEKGRTTNCSPLSYKIPNVSSIPRKFNVTLLKNHNIVTPVYSSKNTGEPPLLLAISVISALKDAVQAARAEVGLHGYFRLDSPATVAKIRSACAEQLFVA